MPGRIVDPSSAICPKGHVGKYKLHKCGEGGKYLTYNCYACQVESIERRRLAIRAKVLAAYGAKCSHCGEDQEMFLCITYEGGGGKGLVKQVGSQQAMLRKLVRENYPSGIQILCWNCNTRASNATDTPTKKYNRKLRDQILDAYGAKCACCGLTVRHTLTLDHFQGGGTAHRATRNPNMIYMDVRNAGFPSDYRLLCCNCNFGESRPGGCIHKRVT